MKKFSFKKILLTVATVGVGTILLNKISVGQSLKSKASSIVKGFRK